MQKSISHEDVVRLAELARIELSPDEVGALEDDLRSILAYVSELSTLTQFEGSDRTYTNNTLRADGDPHTKGEYTGALLAEAPKSDRDYVAVKQIITKRHDH